ncbi:recombinase family protein [Vibrio alginolyticus]|nr:recombinase family protein [Vibrio alginolyticus]
MTIYAYCRVSSQKQLEGLSMKIQGDDALLESLAKKHNTVVSPRVYRDEGKSAYKGMNLQGELGELLNDIDNHQITKGDILVVRHLDRLSRLKIHEATDIYNHIMKSGVRIYATMNDFMYEPNNEIHFLMATLAFKTSNEESEKKSFLTRKYAKYRIDQFQRNEKPDNGTAYDIGIGRHPFYIQLDNKVVQPHPTNFELMREAVLMSIDGKGIGKVRDYLTSHGVDISFSSLGKLLRNNCLYGTLDVTLDDISYSLKNYYPPVCSEHEYYQILAKKGQSQYDNKRNRVSNLGGIRRLYCSCGRAMTVGRDNNREINYYKCSGGTMLSNGMCYTPIRQDIIDKIVLNAIQHHVFEQEPVCSSNLEAMEKKFEHDYQEWVDEQAFVVANRKRFGPEIFANLDKQEAELNALREQIAIERQRVLGSTTEGIEDYQKWQDGIEKYVDGSNDDREECREIIKRLVKKIVIDPRHMISIKLVDDSYEYAYLFSSKERQRVRYYIPISVVSDDIHQQVTETQPELLCKFTTESLLPHHKVELSDVPTSIARLVHQPKYVERDYEAEFFNLLQGDLYEWKRAHILKHTDATTTQWQERKDSSDEVLSKYGWHRINLEITTQSYTKQNKTIIYKNYDETKICELLKCRNIKVAS